MAWLVLVYLVAFVVQAALMGIMMFQAIKLSDLENDFINPHDASNTLNNVVLPEFGLQAFMTLFTLLSGRWCIAIPHLGMLVFNLREVFHSRHYVDVTEVFRDLDKQKIIRNIKLAVYVAVFIVCVYKLVETSVEAFLSPSMRVQAADIFKKAAADM